MKSISPCLVRDADGNPAQGEFSLSLVDKAVLALADPNAPEIMEAFYGSPTITYRPAVYPYANYARRVTIAPPGLGGGGGMGLLPPSSKRRLRRHSILGWLC